MMRLLAALMLAALLLLRTAICLAQKPAASPEPVSPRAAKIHADLEQVLKSGGYEPEKTGEGPFTKMGRWIADRWNGFWEWLRKVFGFGGRIGAGSSPVMPYILVVVLILVIAYAIAYAVKNYQRTPRVTKKKPSVDTIVEPEESAAAEPDAWIAAARLHAAAGDYRRAYRAVFLAILIRLDRRGAIRYERSKTNGDYVRALRNAPDLLAFLRPLANEFDARWYGHVEATKTDFDRLLAQYESAPGAPS